MSEENENNNTSSIDQAATAIAATNDDASSSLNSVLFGSSNDSAVISGGSLNSVGSASLIDLSSTGSLGSGADSLASAYKAGVMSALDQTYYAGALGRSAAVTPYAARAAAPAQDKNTYTIASSRTLWLGHANSMTPAAASGQANLYTWAGSHQLSTGFQGTFGVGDGLGGAIYQQTAGLNIRYGAWLGVGDRAQLWVGDDAAFSAGSGNLGLTYGETANYLTPNGRSLYFGSSSYLSAAGFLGGVADKSQAGASLNADASGMRTNAVSTADDVVMDIGADWGTIGDLRAGYVVPKAAIGNNNKITTGGNVGVFMNASVAVGSNVTMNVAANGGSGFFIGSGGYFSAGINGSYLVHGGMGAAYSNLTTNNAATLIFGDNTTVTLDKANWGNFAAQAGGIISAGNDFHLRALAMSVGYGQDPDTGAIIGVQAATISIGNNAIINLAQSGLTAENDSAGNPFNFYLGSNGAITVDGVGGKLGIGTGATIDGKTISIGNYSKDYSGVNPQTGRPMQYSWYNTGNNNNVTIGSGATINLSGGIALDGNNNNLILAGGGTSGNILNAGFISAGRFYKAYQIPLVNSSSTAGGTKYNYVYDNTSGANVQIGDNYVITLTSGTISTGLANEPTISNNGNFEVNTNAGIFTLGNNVHLTANSMVVGDYYVSSYNPYTSTYDTFTAATSGASITYLADANIQLSGAVLLNGINDKMVFGDRLVLNAATMSFGTGVAGGNQYNNSFVVANDAKLTISNGFINNLSNGLTQFGDSANVHLLAGDLALGGAGVGVAANRNFFHMGANNTLTLDAGSIVITNGRQTFDWGINGTINANSLSFAGTNQVFSMGTGANVSLTGGILVNATSTALTFLDNTTMNLGSGGLTFNQSGSFTLGNGGSFATTGDITFASTAGGTIFNVGNVQTFTAGNVIINAARPTITFGTGINYAVTGWQLNAANDTVRLGTGATGNIGNITFGASARGSLFDTGVANNLVFGNATLVQNATLTLNGTVTGTSLNLSNAAVVNIPAGANVDIGSLVIDGSNGTQQVVINVANGATLNVGSLSTTNVASSNMPKILITGTGHVVIAGQKARASDTLAHEVQFSGNNGIYQYEGNIQDVSGKLTITNFALTDQAIFEVGAAYTDQSRYVTSVVGGVLYVNYVDAATGALTEVAHFNYTPSVARQAAPNVLIVKNDASSTGYDIIITKCFLTGTHILTPEGEVTVENLKAGDSVITLQNGQQVSKQIVWAGNMDVSVNNYEHKDALYPVRIKAHAFGLNQPCRDLLVTPEHTIYVDGGLVPARMLVNGRSIITDTSMDSFTVYHIETEEHSILLSENLTTESYLNTDDRHQFNGSAINLHLTFNENAGHQSWESDAAAPLTVARHQVEPIWQMLDRRATQQGYAPVSKPEVTNDPSLCLITQKGERLQPVDVKGNTYSFYVPANVRVVAMHSKAALPSEVVGPYLDDRRMLGVLVAKINVFGDRNLTILPADMTGLSGWHPAELNRADRWTKGLATLPEAVAEVSTKVKLIKVELTATSEYFVDMIEVAEKIA